MEGRGQDKEGRDRKILTLCSGLREEETKDEEGRKGGKGTISQLSSPSTSSLLPPAVICDLPHQGAKLYTEYISAHVSDLYKTAKENNSQLNERKTVSSDLLLESVLCQVENVRSRGHSSESEDGERGRELHDRDGERKVGGKEKTLEGLEGWEGRR